MILTLDWFFEHLLNERKTIPLSLDLGERSIPTDHFLKEIKKAKSFCFDGSTDLSSYSIDDLVSDELRDVVLYPPFPTTYFFKSGRNHDEERFLCRTALECNDGTVLTIFVKSLLIHEFFPGAYVLVSPLRVYNGNKIVAENTTMQSTTQAPVKNSSMGIYNIINASAEIMIKAVNASRWGVGQINLRKKIKKGKHRHFIKVNEVIYLDQKNKVKQREGITSEPIDWSHQWRVRGHWRKIQGVGKDREGNYCISGHTWVKDFTKGDKDKPLIEKQYVVK